jgi:hypothetical protein
VDGLLTPHVDGREHGAVSDVNTGLVPRPLYLKSGRGEGLGNFFGYADIAFLIPGLSIR